MRLMSMSMLGREVKGGERGLMGLVLMMWELLSLWVVSVLMIVHFEGLLVYRWVYSL